MKCTYCGIEILSVMHQAANRIYVCGKCAAKSCEPIREHPDRRSLEHVDSQRRAVDQVYFNERNER